jgi:hypothetical protein
LEKDGVARSSVVGTRARTLRMASAWACRAATLVASASAPVPPPAAASLSSAAAFWRRRPGRARDERRRPAAYGVRRPRRWPRRASLGGRLLLWHRGVARHQPAPARGGGPRQHGVRRRWRRPWLQQQRCSWRSDGYERKVRDDPLIP